MAFIVEGDRVTIYEDPITCQRREGRATVIKTIRQDSIPNCMRCLVKFVGEDGEYEREVNLYNK